MYINRPLWIHIYTELTTKEKFPMYIYNIEYHVFKSFYEYRYSDSISECIIYGYMVSFKPNNTTWINVRCTVCKALCCEVVSSRYRGPSTFVRRYIRLSTYECFYVYTYTYKARCKEIEEKWNTKTLKYAGVRSIVGLKGLLGIVNIHACHTEKCKIKKWFVYSK